MLAATLQRRRIISQQRLANNLDRRKSLAHECVVELFQAELIPFHFLVVVTQLHDLELAQRVYEIGGITRAPLCFLFSTGVHLIALLHKEVLSYVECHLPGMHLDPDNKARIAKQGILKLS